jgi:hypothetical protein
MSPRRSQYFPAKAVWVSLTSILLEYIKMLKRFLLLKNYLKILTGPDLWKWTIHPQESNCQQIYFLQL